MSKKYSIEEAWWSSSPKGDGFVDWSQVQSQVEELEAALFAATKAGEKFSWYVDGTTSEKAEITGKKTQRNVSGYVHRIGTRLDEAKELLAKILVTVK